MERDYISMDMKTVLPRRQFFPPWSVDSQQSQSKFHSASYFVDINKLILKFIQRGKRSRITNMILKNSKIRGLSIPDSKPYRKATVVKIV